MGYLRLFRMLIFKSYIVFLFWKSQIISWCRLVIKIISHQFPSVLFTPPWCSKTDILGSLWAYAYHLLNVQLCFQQKLIFPETQN